MSPSPEDEEDDYLTMTFSDPTTNSKTETLTQRKKRLARESELKARPKSKAELAAEERRRREEALSKSTVDTSNKGFRMMAALGYKPGEALGVSYQGSQGKDLGRDERLLEPIGLEMKEGKGGIGADSEKKRKFREEVAMREEGEKKRKVEAEEFRERQQKEKEEKKMEGQVFGAMKVCERLEEEDGNEPEVDGVNGDGEDGPSTTRSVKLKNVNVLWRGLLKERLLHERDRRMRYDLHQSLSRLPTYTDVDEEKEDQFALGNIKTTEEVDLDLDEDDEELQQFQDLPVAEKLENLVIYLRERWKYCFWCKFRYPDESMDGCPGTTEADHD